MHELGIAQNIVDAVLLEMQKRQLPSVSSIALRIGVLTDVDPEALTFGFEILTKETALAPTRLKVETVPVRESVKSAMNRSRSRAICLNAPMRQSGDETHQRYGTRYRLSGGTGLSHD